MKHKFLRVFARALLTFGSPSHRIETHLAAVAKQLEAAVEIIHLPNLVILSVRATESRSTTTYFVRSSGKVSLTYLARVDEVYKDVLNHECTVSQGIEAIQSVLKTPPIYPLLVRCFLAFLSSAIICALSFGGSLADMWISGACAGLLQFLGLTAAKRSSVVANVFEFVTSPASFLN